MLKTRFVIFIISAVLCFVFSINSFARIKNPIVCNGTYALCSAAECQQIPGSKNLAFCKCSIWKGENIGYSSCRDRMPKKVDYGQKKILSTFSFGGYHYQYMTCPAGVPWTSCLDQPCLVDKNNPRRAHCTCKIEVGTRYVTFAGGCNTRNCSKSMWSGAKIKDNMHFIKLLSKAMGRSMPDRACKK